MKGILLAGGGSPPRTSIAPELLRRRAPSPVVRGEFCNIIYILTCDLAPVVRVEAQWVRELGEHPLPRDLMVPVPRARGRPRTRYRPQVRTARDVGKLRRHKVLTFLLTPEWVTKSGYPVSFQPWLVIPERLSGSVASEFRTLPIKDEDALQNPGIIELIAFLLRFDPLAARVVAKRHESELDPHELYRRIRNEGLERQATKVRLQQFSRAIPRVGVPLPASELRWIEKNNPAVGVMA